jgi:hypothetical protein
MFSKVIKRYEWYLLGACAVLLTVAGTIGFYETDTGAGNILKSLYLSIQLFILESGAVEDNIAFFSLLNVARWLSPLLLATTAIKTALSFVADDLYRIRMTRLRDHTVILGYNDSLTPMIDNFSRVHMKTRARGQRNKILVVTEHPGNAWITSLKTSRVLFLKQDPTDTDVFSQIKAEHARYIFAVTDNDFVNVTIIKGLFHIKEAHTQSRFLTAYALITDPALKRELQHHKVFIQNTDNFDARVFNPYENSARYLEKELEKLKEKGFPLKPAAVPWAILPEEYKASNRSQADHMEVKLRCVEAEIVDRNPGDPEPGTDEMEKHLGATMIESLAKAEHNRWNAEKWIHGWEYGERDDAFKRHPNLVPWSDLDEDTRNYDRNAIRDIPIILAEVGKRIQYRTLENIVFPGA